jgi:hypothetical protein
MGDGAMAEFRTAIAAVTCAEAILQAVRKRNEGIEPADWFDVRIGLHLGDVIDKDADLFGDTVNIAARIQTFADKGGIAMSHHVCMSVRNQITLRGAYLGFTKLKNIQGKVRIYLIPPLDTHYFRWIIRRRNPVNTRLKAIALALIVVAAWFGYSFMARPLGVPQIALLYVTPVVQTEPDRTKAQVMADQVAEEMDSRGSRIRSFRWKDHGWVVNLIAREGVTDRRNTEMVDVAIGRVARRGKLAYYIIGRIEAVGFWSWMLKVRVVSGDTQSVVANFRAKGDNPSEVASAIMSKLAEWARQRLKAQRR